MRVSPGIKTSNNANVPGPVDAMFSWRQNGEQCHASLVLDSLNIKHDEEYEDYFTFSDYIPPPNKLCSVSGTVKPNSAGILYQVTTTKEKTMKVKKEATINLPREDGDQDRITFAELQVALKATGAPESAMVGSYDDVVDGEPVWVVYFEWTEDV